MNKDLTVGKPSKVLTGFCLPLFASILFQQAYNIADSLVAGKFIDENALAAVGNSYEVTLVFIAFAFGINIGCSVIVSRLFGAKDYTEMKTAVGTTIISGAVVCALLMALGGLFSRNLLQLINTPEHIIADSALYLDIYILGLPFMFFYNIANGIFTALGDSKTPFWFLAASSTANIFMDVLFVAGFGMKIEGVAWATFICQGVSCILALIFVFKRLSKIKTAEKAKPFSLPMLGKIAVIAIPSILQQSFISVGNIIIQGVINSFGSGVMAGYSAAVKLNNLVITSFTTIGNGISNYTSQNIGAGKPERIKPGFNAGIKLMWSVALPVAAAYFFLGRAFVMLFMDNASADALKNGIMFLRIISPFYFVVSAKLTADGVLRGAGLMNRFMAATFTDLVLRVALAAILSKTSLGTLGIWLSWPIGWAVAACMSIAFFYTSLKKLCKKEPVLENTGISQ